MKCIKKECIHLFQLGRARETQNSSHRHRAGYQNPSDVTEFPATVSAKTKNSLTILSVISRVQMRIYSINLSLSNNSYLPKYFSLIHVHFSNVSHLVYPQGWVLCKSANKFLMITSIAAYTSSSFEKNQYCSLGSSCRMKNRQSPPKEKKYKVKY